MTTEFFPILPVSNNREAWLHSQVVVKGTEEANPTSYINHLMRPEVFGTPIVLPADASTPGRYTMSSTSIRELFEGYELNVYHKAIMNPPDFMINCVVR